MAPPNIHPTAIVHPNAQIADDVVIEAHAHVGQFVTIGEGCRIAHGAFVDGQTSLGKNNNIFPYACIGTAPQDKKYKGERTILEIGHNNTFREHTTVNTGTLQGGSKTVLGNNNLLMAATHVGHDCRIGNYCVLSYNVGLSGHIIVDDHAILGGMTGIHQFVRIGTHAFTGGGAKVGKDVPPFTIAQGFPARLRGVNVIGMQRHKYSAEEVSAIRLVYRKFFLSKEDGDRFERARNAFETIPDVVELFLDFCGADNSRGVMHPRYQGKSEDE